MIRKMITPEMLYGLAAGPAIDATPVAVPIGFKKPETMEERLKRFIRRELSEDAARAGQETFEEANDFDIPDDPVDPDTPFEEFFDPALGQALTPDELRRYEYEYRMKYLEAQAEKIAFEDREAAIADAVKKAREKRSAGSGGGSPTPPPSRSRKRPHDAVGGEISGLQGPCQLAGTALVL